MSEFNRETTYSSGVSLKNYITKVMTEMGIGLLITAAVAFAGLMSLARGGLMYQLYMSNAYYFFALAICAVELGICFAMRRSVATANASKARILFYVFSAITGATFSSLLLVFGIPTVFTAFLFTSVMFFSCAVIGHVTNVDLSKFSGLLIGALIALVITTVLSMFIPILRNSLLISYAGIVIFLFYTAWDMQKIKQFYYQSQYDAAMGESLAIYGAFELYLDFINLFVYILRILGSRSRD